MAAVGCAFKSKSNVFMIVKERREVGVFNVDWLAFSVKLEQNGKDTEIMCPLGCDIEVCKGTRQYRNRVIVYDHVGNKVLTLLWVPVNNTIDSRLMLVEVGNSYLYNDGIYSAWLLLNACVACKFNNMSRVDLCCDFEVDTRKQVVINGLSKKRLYVAQKSEGSSFWSGDLKDHDFNWGSPHSQFKWKLYDKSLELGVKGKKENYDKPYIVNEWIDAGYAIEFVWRLELSIVNVSKFEVLNRKLLIQDLFSMYYPIAIFLNQMDRRFVIRKKQGHTRKSNDKVVEFLKFYQPRLKMKERISNERNLYAGAAEFFNLKRQIEESKTIVTNKKLTMSYYELAMQIAHDYKLDFHFNKIYGKVAREMLDEALAQSGYYWECGLD